MNDLVRLTLAEAVLRVMFPYPTPRHVQQGADAIAKALDQICLGCGRLDPEGVHRSGIESACPEGLEEP